MLCAAAGLGLGGCGSAALQTASPPQDVSPAATTVIFDCTGKSRVRPTALTLYCADAGEVLADIRWQTWGTATASASALDVLNTCKPDCAAGHSVSKHVTLTASGLALSGTSATYQLLTIRSAESAARFSLTINGPAPK